MVGSQIDKLILNLSFGHNLCFKCPNGSCNPISDIYITKAFQWYKELFNSMSFDPCNCSLKIQESIGTPTPKVGAHLEVWRFIFSHSLTLSGVRNMIPGLSLLTHTFTSPCFGHEPKVRVTTIPKTHVIWGGMWLVQCENKIKTTKGIHLLNLLGENNLEGVQKPS